MSVKFDTKELKGFIDKLNVFGDRLDEVIVEALEEIALRELSMVAKITPVDIGTLRNAWKISNIKKTGSGFEITVYNNTEYANYVEFGHRTRDHKNWVPGKFMLTISEREVEKVMDKIIDRHLEEAFSKL